LVCTANITEVSRHRNFPAAADDLLV
jgi:hypothetical protein